MFSPLILRNSHTISNIVIDWDYKKYRLSVVNFMKNFYIYYFTEFFKELKAAKVI